MTVIRFTTALAVLGLLSTTAQAQSIFPWNGVTSAFNNQSVAGCTTGTCGPNGCAPNGNFGTVPPMSSGNFGTLQPYFPNSPMPGYSHPNLPQPGWNGTTPYNNTPRYDVRYDGRNDGRNHDQRNGRVPTQPYSGYGTSPLFQNPGQLPNRPLNNNYNENFQRQLNNPMFTGVSTIPTRQPTNNLPPISNDWLFN